MRTIQPLIRLLCAGIILSSHLAFSQEQPVRPAYVTVSTTHWNMDYEDFDMETWKAVEKEYFDKVTSKNELIMGSGYYMHRFTPDNRELLVVNTFANWEDIDKSNARTEELVNEGWPDEAARDAYFAKRNAYYSDYHSDEIYAPLQNAKVHDRKKAPILLVRKSYLNFPDDGNWEPFSKHMKEVFEHVYNKNELIKGYYPNRHAWGSDSKEFLQAFFVDTMADLDAMFDRNGELFEAHWADEASRNQAEEVRRRYLNGIHGDYIYTVVPELIK